MINTLQETSLRIGAMNISTSEQLTKRTTQMIWICSEIIKIKSATLGINYFLLMN